MNRLSNETQDMNIPFKTRGLYAALLLMAWNVIAPAIHAEIVYDNVRDYRQSFYPPSPGSAEYGDQVQLAGKARTITEFRFEYFGEFQATGTEMVRVRLMSRTGPERFRMGVEMFEAARRMVLASLPADLSETERKRRLFERLYGEALPTQVGG